MRVHELADSYSITPQDCMMKLAECGIFVRNRLSELTPDEVEDFNRSQNGEPQLDRAVAASLITTAEAAKHSKVTSATIRKWVERGKLEVKGKSGRTLLFDPKDLPVTVPLGGASKTVTFSESFLRGEEEHPHLYTAEEIIFRFDHPLAPATFRVWVMRGKLKVRGKLGRKNLYMISDVEKLLTEGREREVGRLRKREPNEMHYDAVAFHRLVMKGLEDGTTTFGPRHEQT